MTKDEIKERVSVSDVLAKYGVELNRHGFCQCPLPSHTTDRIPSFKVYFEQNTFHCFGCGASGDVFTLVELMENCDFYSAFTKLGGHRKSKSKMSAKEYVQHIRTEIESKNKIALKEQIKKEWDYRIKRNCERLGALRATLEILLKQRDFRAWKLCLEKYEHEQYINDFYIQYGMEHMNDV